MLTLLKNINSEVLLRSLVSMPVTKENAVQPASIENRRISYARHISGADSDIAGVTTLGAWVRACSSDAMRAASEHLLTIEDKEELAAAKRKLLPVCFPSAVLSIRDKNKDISEKLVTYSGLICVDIDTHDRGEALVAVNTLARIPYIAFSSLSASGRGAYAVAVTDNMDFGKHKLYWRAVSDDIAERTGYENDPLTKDVTRARFMAYTPSIAFGDSVFPFTLPEGYEEPTAVEYSDADEDFPPDDTTLAAVEDCVRQWEEDGLVLGETTYGIRYDLGTALKNLGEAGFKFYERLCRGYTHPRTPRQEWDMFPDNAATDNTNENKIRLGRFFKIMELKFHIKPTEEEVRLPLNDLRPEITKIVRAVSAAYQCPPEFAVLSMYGAVAAVAGKKFALWDGLHTNFAQIWAAVVSPSGAGKSEVLGWFFRPIEERQTGLHKAYWLALKEWKEGGEQGPRPVYHRYTAVDTTPEVRNQILADNPNGLCLRVDELKGLFDDFGRYQKSGEVSRLLSIFSNDSYDVDRKSGEPLRIEAPALSIIGGIQPRAFSAAFGTPQFSGNGFLPRWCFVWGDNLPRRSSSHPTIPSEIVRDWRGIVSRIEGVGEARIFQLSNEAREIYDAYFDEIEEKIHGLRDDDKREVLAKVEINCLRWALITAILAGEYASVSPEISPESMEYAVECFRYFEQTGFRAVEAARGQSSQMTKKDALLALYRAYPTLSRARLAEAIGTSMPYLSKVLKGPK